MAKQTTFKVTLLRIRSKSEEIEAVGIFENLLCQFRLWSWQCSVKVGQSLSLSAVQAAFDLVNQDIPAPTVLDGLAYVPFALTRIFHVVEDTDVMTPGDLCNKLLHKRVVRPGFRESPHVLIAVFSCLCPHSVGVPRVACCPCVAALADKPPVAPSFPPRKDASE